MAGLAAGLIAGCLMNEAQRLYRKFLAGKSANDKSKPPPATVQAAEKASELLTGHPLAQSRRKHADTVVHYAFGALLGLVYGIVAEFRGEVTAAKGAAFGLGASAVFDEALVPALGLSGPPWAYPLSSHLYGVASHLIYGTTLETARKALRGRLVATE